MSSSSSSSNNPLLAEDNNNNNENNDQNKNKQIDDTLKFLEEDSNIAPPPAYEDIEKPPPTLPGYNSNGRPTNNDLSYPSPSAPPTENYSRPSFFSRPSNSSNFNKRNGPVACCGSRRNRGCSCGWLIVLFIFVILTVISVINNNVCSKLTFGDNPEKFSFDPTTINLLRIDVDPSRIKRGNVNVFVGQPNQQQVEIEVLTGSNGVTPKFSTSIRNGIYELDISQTSGFSLFNIPPRCMKMQTNVYLPPSSPTAIQVRDLNIVVNNNFEFQQTINLTTDTGDILLNGTSAQNINILSRDGDIYLKNATVKGVFNITTLDDGDVKGSINLSNNFSFHTIDGNANLLLKIAQGANTNIEFNTVDGEVLLNFDGTFLGKYTIQADDGAIQVNNDGINGGFATGTVGTGENNLSVSSDDGNVLVLF